MNKINRLMSMVAVAFFCMFGCSDDGVGSVSSDNNSEDTTPSCNDGIQNGDETGIDCGGSCNKCTGTETQTPDIKPAQKNCSDDAKNGDETDVDCGGSCDRCANEMHCEQNSDCLSDNCVGGTCEPKSPLCVDGELSGDETDIDCGGSCGKCANGMHCRSDEDCSGFCDGDICISCNDGLLNGDETDTDCGGRCGATCVVGEGCNTDNDCELYNCVSKSCQNIDCPDMAAVGEIIINEVFANPDVDEKMAHTNNDQMKFIELYNKSDKALSLYNLSLKYNENEVHSRGCIPAKTYLVIHPDDQTLTALDIDAKTLASDNIETAISSISGNVSLIKRSDSTVIHSAVVPVTEIGTSAGRAQSEENSTNDEVMVPHTSIQTIESNVNNYYSPGLPNNVGFPMG